MSRSITPQPLNGGTVLVAKVLPVLVLLSTFAFYARALDNYFLSETFIWIRHLSAGSLADLVVFDYAGPGARFEWRATVASGALRFGTLPTL